MPSNSDPAASSARPPSQSTRRRGVWGSRLTLLFGLLGLGFLACEGGLRFLLFHPSAGDLKWCEFLRNPALYADPFVEDVYWRLRWVFDESSRGKPSAFDPLLGWTDGRLTPDTYELTGAPGGSADGRRPILLYGASQAACREASDGCFETQLAQSPLSADFTLVNYAIGGQGVDQMYLLARETVPRHAAEEPVVVIAAVAGTDFERCNMTFRVWPKPLLTPRGEGLDLLPPAPSVQSFMERNGMGVRSYAWRGLLHGTEWLPRGLRDRLAGGARRRAEQDARVEGIVRALSDELERQGVSYFFLLLHGPRTLHPEESRSTLFTAAEAPPDEALLALFERLDVPYVDTRPYLAKDSDRALFRTSEGRPQVPSAEGYAVLFEALADGLRRTAPSAGNESR